MGKTRSSSKLTFSFPLILRAFYTYRKERLPGVATARRVRGAILKLIRV
jgi:hypothetical protein